MPAPYSFSRNDEKAAPRLCTLYLIDFAFCDWRFCDFLSSGTERRRQESGRRPRDNVPTSYPKNASRASCNQKAITPCWSLADGCRMNRSQSFVIAVAWLCTSCNPTTSPPARICNKLVLCALPVRVFPGFPTTVDRKFCDEPGIKRGRILQELLAARTGILQLKVGSTGQLHPLSMTSLWHRERILEGKLFLSGT